MLLTGLLLVLGVALGRVDLVLLAAPFAIGVAMGLRRRPSAAPQVVVEADDAYVVEGGEVAAALTVVNPDDVGYDVVVVRTRVAPWLELPGADRPFAVSVPAGAENVLELPGTARRWGRHNIGPAAARVAACGRAGRW